MKNLLRKFSTTDSRERARERERGGVGWGGTLFCKDCGNLGSVGSAVTELVRLAG